MYGYIAGSKGMDEAREREYAATQAVSAIRTQVYEAEKAEFEAAGGCKRCRGRGWILTWDTLDSLSGCYAEFGPCPEKCGSGKKTGKPYLRTGRSKYDRINYEPEHDLDQLAAEHGFGSALSSAQADVERAKQDWLKEQEKATITKGTWVRVVKGRKVPKGTEGLVIWVGEGTWGWRIGFKPSEDAEPLWTAATNVKIANRPATAGR